MVVPREIGKTVEERDTNDGPVVVYDGGRDNAWGQELWCDLREVAYLIEHRTPADAARPKPPHCETGQRMCKEVSASQGERTRPNEQHPASTSGSEVYLNVENCVKASPNASVDWHE